MNTASSLKFFHKASKAVLLVLEVKLLVVGIYDSIFGITFGGSRLVDRKRQSQRQSK